MGSVHSISPSHPRTALYQLGAAYDEGMRKGPANSAAAVFIFKDDEKSAGAYIDCDEIPIVNAEAHTTKQAFLAGLRAWHNLQQNHENSHLLIYAHGHATGLATKLKGGAELTTWVELQNALPNGVAVLWILACRTNYVLGAWPTPGASPVHSTMLVTTADRDWQELLKLFRKEVDINDFAFFDEMHSYISQRAPKFRCRFRYLDAKDPGKWRDYERRRWRDPENPQAPWLEILQACWDRLRVTLRRWGSRDRS